MEKSKKAIKGGSSGFRIEMERKKVLNPFEVHVNKLKFQVLGRKLKADSGVPGVSRSKALKKRKATLLQEYKIKDKSNKFLDRRIGERNSAMTVEDRMTARFTAERKRAQSKVSVFNLADEEILTHKGQTLNEIEKFDDPRSDEDDDDLLNSKGNLDSEFVGGAHFGGGLLSHTSENAAKSRKDLIDQLIIESKKRKAEKKRQHEETADLTQKLDSDWKDLLPVMAVAPKASDVLKPKPDSYDVALRQLIFEARGRPSDKLKSAEDVAREEKETLEKLEAERLRRMQGIAEMDDDSTPKHRSADDLDDDFAVESDSEAESADEQGNPSENDDTVENSEDGGSTSGESKEEEGSLGESSSEESDDLSDLKGDFSDCEEDTIDKNPADSDCFQSSEKSGNNSQSTLSKTESIREDLRRRKNLMEAARKELPYTFSVPDSYEEFQILMAGREPHYQVVIVERMVKCTHPSLNAGNKDRLGILFTYLMQHLYEAVSEESPNDCWDILDRLSPYLFDITHWCINSVADCLRTIFQQKQHEYRKKKKFFPGVDTLIYFKIVSLLFPTSDFSHPVVTPCVVFMGQILSSCHIQSRQDVSKAIFIISLFLEFTSLSKRFSPEAINTLRNLLFSSSEFSNFKDDGKLPAIRPLPPMKLSSPYLSILRPKDISSLIPLKRSRLLASDLISTADVDDDFCTTAVFVCLKITSAFLSQLISLSACRHIFHPFFCILESISKDKWIPNAVKEELAKLENLLHAVRDSKLKFLSISRRPTPLELFEPRILPVYADGKQQRPISKAKQEREKLLHKIKREKKGALRELRKDRDFLAKIRLAQQLKSDADRKAKVKEIFGDAATQQGELRKIAKNKK